MLLVRFGRSMVHLKAENPPFHNCASKNSDWQDFQLERHWLHPSSQSWLWHQHPDETPISAIVNWSEKNEGITDRIKTNEKALKNIRKPANHTYHADSVVVLAQNTVWEELPREKGEKLQRNSAAGESIDFEPKKHQKTKKERSLVNWLLKKMQWNFVSASNEQLQSEIQVNGVTITKKSLCWSSISNPN